MKKLARTCSRRARSKEQVDLVRNYYTAQGMFGIPRKGECDYSVVLELDLGVDWPKCCWSKAAAGSNRTRRISRISS